MGTLTRTHQREDLTLPNTLVHKYAKDALAHTKADSGRHSILECLDEIIVRRFAPHHHPRLSIFVESQIALRFGTGKHPRSLNCQSSYSSQSRGEPSARICIIDDNIRAELFVSTHFRAKSIARVHLIIDVNHLDAKLTQEFLHRTRNKKRCFY